MRRDKALKILHSHKSDIENLGVKSLALFGSTARDEAGPKSDIDILVEFNKKQKTFDHFMELKFYLESLLGQHVDLVTTSAIKPRLRPYIKKDIVYVS